MEAFLERKRPPEHIRPKLDIGYKIEDQSIIIYEIRQFWNGCECLMEKDAFKEIRIRKSGRTNFIDDLREKLIARIQEGDI